ncbi:hypothetical protein P7K49_015047 [Saguinus oedipus]|uniref:Uncharacterized protein n=1 Tax=Saguinus oedipus TaxID=9490 RepID=A0ABQ9VA36_SAGOE|nr:hypothetical protein P7K49_015047 [Saguinus oedipus]
MTMVNREPVTSKRKTTLKALEKSRETAILTSHLQEVLPREKRSTVKQDYACTSRRSYRGNECPVSQDSITSALVLMVLHTAPKQEVALDENCMLFAQAMLSGSRKVNDQMP